MNKKKTKKKQEKVKMKKSNWVAFAIRTCEICGATAINVAGEQSNQESNASAHSQTTAGQTQTETRGTWHGRCVMNFLLAAMIFAFIICPDEVVQVEGRTCRGYHHPDSIPPCGNYPASSGH
uniref:Uncharacterized protein n=1 Tax=Brassica oleracea var. oleracea TaxID=109376 RepID=A0A0D3DRZ7_BRAOL